jgi:hypothetical protein
MSNYHTDSVTEEMILNAEKVLKMDGPLSGPHGELEAFTIGLDYQYTVLKASSSHAQYDVYWAGKMKEFFDSKGVWHAGDPESARDVIISTNDFMKLFGGE